MRSDASLHATTATFTTTIAASNHAAVMAEAKRTGDAYWGRTPYKVTVVHASHGKATVTTQALEAVAS